MSSSLPVSWPWSGGCKLCLQQDVRCASTNTNTNPGAGRHSVLVAHLNVQCMVDASALMWREKIRHNAVRPISAIRHIYEDADVTAWAQDRGRQTFPGREWESYLRCVCALLLCL